MERLIQITARHEPPFAVDFLKLVLARRAGAPIPLFAPVGRAIEVGVELQANDVAAIVAAPGIRAAVAIAVLDDLDDDVLIKALGGRNRRGGSRRAAATTAAER
jgi:hypothetical protein